MAARSTRAAAETRVGVVAQDAREEEVQLAGITVGELLAAHAAGQSPKDPTAIGAMWHVCPDGPIVVGRDGRRFAIEDGAALAEAFAGPIPLDRDHESMRWGGSTESLAWFDNLEYRPGEGFYARLEHIVDEAKVLLDEKRFRFVSPVIRIRWPSAEDIENGASPEPVVTAFLNIALTNRPNLRLAALNSEQGSNAPTPEPERLEHNGDSMKDKSLSALAAQLGLAPGATEEQLANAVHEKMVPRADYDAAMNRADTAEATLRKHKDEEHSRRAEEVLQSAVKSGRIAPASLDYHRATCASPEGLERFQQFVAKQPALLADDPATANEANEANGVKLSAEEAAFAAEMGIDPKDMLNAKKEEL